MNDSLLNLSKSVCDIVELLNDINKCSVKRDTDIASSVATSISSIILQIDALTKRIEKLEKSS